MTMAHRTDLQRYNTQPNPDEMMLGVWLLISFGNWGMVYVTYHVICTVQQFVMSLRESQICGLKGQQEQMSYLICFHSFAETVAVVGLVLF